MALVCSASVSVAAECAVDPNECTLKKLCEVATNVDGNNATWSTATGSAKHVTLSQSLGMECGVTPIVDLCDTDPSECKVSQICGKATTNNAGEKSWDDSADAYVAMAKEYGLQCDVSEEAVVEKVTTDFKQAFKSEPKLRRQQLQYALKQLGYYSYGADGLWGKGTSSAFDKFVSAYGLKGKTEAQVFSSLLSKTTVPSSFAVPKKKVAKTPKSKADKNGLFPEYVCTADKVDMKSSVFGLSTNKGMTVATVVGPDGQRKKLSRKETKEAIKEFKLDTPMVFKFSNNKVKFVNLLMGKKEISELLKAASPEDRPEITRIFDQLSAPTKFYIRGNIVSWSVNFSLTKFMPGLRMNGTYSINLITNQYINKAKAKIPYVAGEMKMTTWATCEPN